jgi:hypothetical protein
MEEMAGGRGDVLSIAAVQIDTQELEGATGVDLARLASCTTVTGNHRINGYPVTDLVASYFRANFDDHAPEFMPLNGGVIYPTFELSQIDMQIGATDSGGFRFDHALLRANGGQGGFAHPNIFCIVKNTCFHFFYSTKN